MLPNYYQILGVQSKANLSEIKSAYKRRAMECHPDRGGSHERMVAVNEAWEILSDPNLRRLYNEVRTGAATAGISNAAEQNAREAKKRAQNYPEHWEDFDKWLRALSADFVAAEYADESTGEPPWVKNSVSGAIFVITGAIVGFALGYFLVRNRQFSGGLVIPFALMGAWGGVSGHKFIRDHLPTDDTNRPGLSVEQPTQARAETIIPCSKCGQKLRIPQVSRSARITCPSCKHRFVQY